MLFLVILLIVLGWAGWFWAWGRDRFESNPGLSLPPSPLSQRPVSASAFAPPRSAVMARRRRREVLGALALTALLTFLLARAWAPVWFVHIAVDLALVAFAAATYALERPSSAPTFVGGSQSALRRLQPVMESQIVVEEQDARPVH